MDKRKRGREIRKGGKTEGCKVGEIKQEFREDEESKRGEKATKGCL